MKPINNIALGIVLFAIWVAVFFYSYFLLGAFMFGELQISSDWAWPLTMVVMVLFFLSYASALDFILKKVER